MQNWSVLWYNVCWEMLTDAYIKLHRFILNHIHINNISINILKILFYIHFWDITFGFLKCKMLCKANLVKSSQIHRLRLITDETESWTFPGTLKLPFRGALTVLKDCWYWGAAVHGEWGDGGHNIMKNGWLGLRSSRKCSERFN